MHTNGEIDREKQTERRTLITHVQAYLLTERLTTPSTNIEGKTEKVLEYATTKKLRQLKRAKIGFPFAQIAKMDTAKLLTF